VTLSLFVEDWLPSEQLCACSNLMAVKSNLHSVSEGMRALGGQPGWLLRFCR
jgi:hypothetical protein